MANKYTKAFAMETDLICVDEDEYQARKPYHMDKWEIMNMLEDKPRDSVLEKKAENHYILYLSTKFLGDSPFHFICPIYADKEVKEWWNDIRWILNNLFVSKTGKEERLFYQVIKMNKERRYFLGFWSRYREEDDEPLYTVECFYEDAFKSEDDLIDWWYKETE